MRIKKSLKIRFPKQRAEEIARRPFFQKEIARLRKKWRISVEGFQSNEESKQWHNWMAKISDDYLESEDYWKEVEHIKKRQELPSAEYPYTQELEDWKNLRLKVPINQYKNDLLTFREQLNLSNYWGRFIERYLMFNDLYGVSNNTAIEMQKKEKTGEWELYLRIWEHTRISDIKSIWSDVKVHQERIPGFKKTFRDSNVKIIERNEYIMALYGQGKNAKEIAQSVYKRFVGSDDARYDDIYNLTDFTVRKIISDMQKKRESK